MEDEVQNNTSSHGGEVNETTNHEVEQKSDKQLLDSYMKKEKITVANDNPIKSESTPVDKSLSAEGQKDQKKMQGHGKANERIGELTRKYHSSKSELETLRKEFEEYKKNAKPISRAETSSDEEYIAKLTEQQVNDRLANENMKRLETEASNAQTAAWEENIRSQVEDYNDFATKYTKYAPVLSQHDAITSEYVMKSNVGPKMLSELFTRLEDPNFADAWFNMPTAKKNIVLYELEKHVSRPMQQPTVTKTNAPKPIVPGNGSHGNTPKSDKELLDAYMNRKR